MERDVHEAAAPLGLPYIKMITRGRLLAVHARNTASEPDLAVPSFGLGDAHMVAIHLVAMEADVWRNGRHLGRLSFAPGEVQFFDMRQTWRAVLHPPYETVNLRVPFELLAEAGGVEPAALSFDPPAITPGEADPTMLGLARALVPAFSRPGELSELFVDRVLFAVATHLMQVHGGLDPQLTLERPKQGLVVWQQRRAARMLLDRLDDDVPLGELAAACGLSTSHFARAFRLSFGLPPHRWLMRERVRRAAELLEGPLPIHEIAIACGFVDQSHLSRVFRKVMDMPPAAWRRSRRASGAPDRANPG